MSGLVDRGEQLPLLIMGMLGFGLHNCCSQQYLSRRRVGGREEHRRFVKEGAGVREWRGAEFWSRLRDGAESDIKGMSCTDDDDDSSNSDWSSERG